MVCCPGSEWAFGVDYVQHQTGVRTVSAERYMLGLKCIPLKVSFYLTVVSNLLLKHSGF